MKRWIIALSVFAVLGFPQAAINQERGKYPPPRFPSYVKPPKSLDDVLPFARAAVRQTGGRTPLGLVEKGQTVAIFTEPAAEEMILQGIKRAYEERGVKVQMVAEHQLLGVKKEEALKAIKANRWYTSEHGYMEVRSWILQRFGDAEIPKSWLKERRPDLYKAVFQKEEESSQELIEPHGSRFYGNFIFVNRYELMNKAATFPGDIWRLAEERVIEPLSWIDRVEVSDPEGTRFSFELNEKQAQAWADGVYQQGHLFMFPHQATGRFPYSSVDYPAFTKKYNPRYLVKVNGVFAGTNNHTGSFSKMEVHVKDGYVKEVKGGGTYGELWREFLKYPKINEATYPYHDQPGYWWIYEAGMGTNPKFFKRPDENMEGSNSSERNNAGVIHWGFGLRLDHGPDKAVESKEWMDFAKQNALPNDHWWHIHNFLPTYRVKVRGTKNSWLTLIDRGEVTALKSPEIRALASRYGNPDEVLSDDWAPHLPGVNAPGKFEDYAKDPWKTLTAVINKIQAGSYEYFYPEVKTKKP